VGSTQVTLVANQPSSVIIPAPCGRVVVTMMSAPSEVWMTSDGTGPVDPSSAILTSTQTTLAGAVGAQAVLQPTPMPGGSAPGPAGPGGSKNPQIQLMSVGTPVLELVW
jgi:hypothetical protein